MFEYDIESQKSAEILDKYDLTDCLRQLRANGAELFDACEALGKISPEIKNAIEGLTEDELLDYLHIRYNIHYSEQIIYYIY